MKKILYVNRYGSNFPVGVADVCELVKPSFAIFNFNGDEDIYFFYESSDAYELTEDIFGELIALHEGILKPDGEPCCDVKILKCEKEDEYTVIELEFEDQVETFKIKNLSDDE